jgi:hypothetical protein
LTQYLQLLTGVIVDALHDLVRIDGLELLDILQPILEKYDRLFAVTESEQDHEVEPRVAR